MGREDVQSDGTHRMTYPNWFSRTEIDRDILALASKEIV